LVARVIVVSLVSAGTRLHVPGGRATTADLIGGGGQRSSDAPADCGEHRSEERLSRRSTSRSERAFEETVERLRRRPPSRPYPRHVHRIVRTSVSSVYPHYLAKVEKKGRTQEELDRVIEWLTGFDGAALHGHLAAGTTFEEFFAAAVLNPGASSITGTICGVRVEDIDDPLMRKIRYLDKLVDELARGRSIDKVLRS
jgi:hypothetical protein